MLCHLPHLQPLAWLSYAVVVLSMRWFGPLALGCMTSTRSQQVLGVGMGLCWVQNNFEKKFRKKLFNSDDSRKESFEFFLQISAIIHKHTHYDACICFVASIWSESVVEQVRAAWLVVRRRAAMDAEELLKMIRELEMHLASSFNLAWKLHELVARCSVFCMCCEWCVWGDITIWRVLLCALCPYASCIE